ncbi:MAG: transporter [Devosia sp.]|uniref:MFS transporter n=1 Tax=Devosia sp. TaxID=1871048 RepID=UPI00260AC409|nr:MFS transporter [Devosia sp.]MDB5528760.1 transporter [Devosia sp.]
MSGAGVPSRLDSLPLTRLHLAAAALCAAGMFVDVAELALSVAFSAIFSAPPHSLDATQLGMLLASVFVGGAIGSPLFGWLADRHGRRLALQLSLLLVAAPSLGAAFSPDANWLIFFRLLSGMALGAYPPLMSAFLADIMPPKRRAPIMLTAVSIGLLGAPLVALLVWWLTPLAPLGIEGWRWALIGMGAMAGMLAPAFVLLPESPRWLAARGRADEADRACRRFEAAAGIASPPVVSELAAAAASTPPIRGFGAHWPNVVLIAALYLMRPWATVGFPVIAGAVLIAKSYRLDQSLASVGIGGFGAALGALLAATVVDRLPRRTSLAICSLALMGAGLLFAIGNDLMVLVLAMAAFNFLAAIYGPLLSIYAAEIFPTGIRASATATAWSANRIGSALAPLALLPLLQFYGPVLVLATIAATLLVNLILIAAFGPRGLAGQPLMA